VTVDNPRLFELRRRVQADPASIAFAQLAEECRRAGETEEAIAVCRAGLAFHPEYLSARVTLGRALSELKRLDEARDELAIVVAKAPDNLAANRALAEVYRHLEQLPEALTFYKKALALAHHDPELERAVETIQQAVAPPEDAKPVSIEELFDFDSLLQQLGEPLESKPIAPVRLDHVSAAPGTLDKVELPSRDTDPFALLERQLRESEGQRAVEPSAVVETRSPEENMIAELELWLETIVMLRSQQATS
jgi:tetratricopeptide (TPR) repeat protein